MFQPIRNRPLLKTPLSRRSFLAGTLTAGAGLLLPGCLSPSSRGTDKHSWALFSDTHIAAAPDTRLHDIVMADHFRRIAGEILARRPRPVSAIVTGDLALNSGQTGDYETLKTLLEPFRMAGIPVHLVPGNHDVRERLWAALPECRMSAVPGRQAGRVRGTYADWILLDSLEKTPDSPGSLGAEQLAWLVRTLDANRRKPVLLAVHHNPSDRPGALRDTRELLDIIRPRRQVKAWFFGHSHKWDITRDESGIHLVNLPPAAYVFQPESPAGWVLATLRKDGVRLELRCLEASHPRHGETAELAWRAD